MSGEHMSAHRCERPKVVASCRCYYIESVRATALSQAAETFGRRVDLLCFYGTVIRPVLEYACPVWHTNLTAAQTKALESLQRTALCIIYEDGDYMLSLIRAGFDTLEARREQLTSQNLWSRYVSHFVFVWVSS